MYNISDYWNWNMVNDAIVLDYNWKLRMNIEIVNFMKQHQ